VDGTKMRFDDYLVESAEFEMVVKDLQPKMHDLYRVLKKNHFQMSDKDIAIYLNAAFRKKRIQFDKGPSSGTHWNPLIDSAGITDELDFIVDYVPGYSKYFKRFAKEGKFHDFFDIAKNQFFRGLAEVLAHEYRHKFQSLASSHKSFKVQALPDVIGWEKYRSNKHELDAFALQSAIQILRTGKSIVLNQYQGTFQGKDKKTWNRFLKKTNANIKKLKSAGLEKYIKVG